jgi:hypothetical protein
MTRVGQDRVFTPYLTVCLMISVPELLFTYVVLANPVDDIILHDARAVLTSGKRPKDSRHNEPSAMLD